MFYKTINGRWGETPVYFYSPTLGLWNWKLGNKYYLSEKVGQGIKIDGGATYYPSGFFYNGYDYYICSPSLWRDKNYYYLTYFLGFGTLDTLPWWKKSVSGGVAGTYTKQGTATSDKVVTLVPIAGWESSQQFGVYIPVPNGGKTGDRYLGARKYKYKSNPDAFFVETLTQYGGKPTFTGGLRWLWWASNKWIISNKVGVADPKIGYWKRESSVIEGTYTRVYEGSGVPPEPESYTLAAPIYEEGNNRTSIYMAQVALWI